MHNFNNQQHHNISIRKCTKYQTLRNISSSENYYENKSHMLVWDECDFIKECQLLSIYFDFKHNVSFNPKCSSREDEFCPFWSLYQQCIFFKSVMNTNIRINKSTDSVAVRVDEFV